MHEPIKAQSSFHAQASAPESSTVRNLVGYKTQGDTTISVTADGHQKHHSSQWFPSSNQKMARITHLFGLASLAILSLVGSATANPLAAAAAAAPALSRRGAGSGGGKPVEKHTAQQVVAKLGLAPNPEKGYYKETFRDTLSVSTANNGTSRPASTAIYYLLEGAAGQSLWHRIDAAEVWHYYAGAPLTLSLSLNDESGVREVVLGPDIFRGQQPQVVVRSWEWQSARSEGDWTLVGTTVAPAFDPSLYEIAEAGWNPN
ncbi:hypothetical protein VTK56DRAFT_3596 [Thermocarpiscus australiensis]